jgi:hypothetical protein
VQVISARIISLSYPWIGLPMELFRARHQSSVPFICAHITRVIVYYSVYEATQLAFAEWFYGQGRPSQRELWLFAIMMLWEYYGMIYIRSTSSIRLFPRASLALFLLYHFYLFSCPSGFHLLALLVMFMFLTALMIHCVRKYEYDAYHRGLVNIDQPRALFNNLPWPSWAVALAPDYTLFMPVTARSSSLYAHAVPPVHEEAPPPPPVGRGVVNTSITAVAPSTGSSSSSGASNAATTSSSSSSSASSGSGDLLTGDIEMSSPSSSATQSLGVFGIRARGGHSGSPGRLRSGSSGTSGSVVNPLASAASGSGAGSIPGADSSSSSAGVGASASVGASSATGAGAGNARGILPQLAGARGTYSRLDHDSRHGGDATD